MDVGMQSLGEGEVVVFLHGFFGDGEDFRGVAEGLGEEGWRAVLLELPGHGASPFCAERWEEEPGTGIEKMGRAVEAQLGAEGVEGGHLVGYSMGGRVALWLALRGELTWRSLTVVSGSPGISEAEERRARAALDRGRAEAIRARGLGSFLEDWYQLDLFAGLRRREGFKETLRRRSGQDAEAMATLIEAMSPGNQEDLWPRLKDLAMPTLWVAGEEDGKYVEMLARAAAQTPTGELTVLEGVGHSVHLEQPVEFSRRLRRFLTSGQIPRP